MNNKKIQDVEDSLAQELCANLNWNVLMEHLEDVEEGYAAPDEGYFRALRARSDADPQGLFLHPKPKIEKAIRTATRLHEGQWRKGEKIKMPYISHPLTVAEMLAGHTQDEDVLAAAVLHDTLEDGETLENGLRKKYTPENLRRDFGEQICRMVQEVTEDLELKKKDNKGTWRERKILYLAHLYRASFEARLICCADKIHNLTDMIPILESGDPALLSQFNASPADRLWFHREVLLCLKQKLPHPLVGELEEVVRRAKFPRYFLVGDISVKVDLDPATGEIFGVNSSGNPFPPIKARAEGTEISEAEFAWRHP